MQAVDVDHRVGAAPGQQDGSDQRAAFLAGKEVCRSQGETVAAQELGMHEAKLHLAGGISSGAGAVAAAEAALAALHHPLVHGQGRCIGVFDCTAMAAAFVGSALQGRPAAGFGRPARVRLRAADGAWQVEVVQPTSQSTGGNLRQVTEFIAARPTWPGGMVIVGPALPPETASFASMLLASLDNPLGRRLVAGLVGADLADLAVGLRPVGGAAGVTALASAELPATIDLDTIAASLRGWSQIRRGEEGFPILIVSPDGVRLRLRHAITDPDGFVSFIALARGVVGYLGRPI